MRAVLFDIDGTLVTTRGAGREAFALAVHEAYSIPLPQAHEAIGRIDFRGGTDEVLLERVAAELGLSLPRFHDPLIDAYLRVLDRTMTPARVAALPGVQTLVRELEARGDIRVGLLTGNIRAGAQKKLAVVALDWLVTRPGGFAEDGRDRPAIAAEALRQMTAGGADAGRVVVIGDTQHDVSAARSIGAAAIAVTTGGTDRDVLVDSGADLVLDSLERLDSVLELVDRL